MSDVDAAVAALAAGSLVGLPTDTVYGVAADLRSERAVNGLFALKARGDDKPIAVLGASVRQLSDVALVDDRVGALATEAWPGALTLVVRRRSGLPEWVGNAATDTVGIRIPDHPVALELLGRTGPLAVTSANRSGDRPVTDDRAARSLFGDDVAVYLPGGSGGATASTVVDVTGDRDRVLREGPVPWTVST